MDLTTLSDADFKALQSGDLTSMSDAGFAQLLKTQAATMPKEERAALNLEADRKRFAPTVGMSTGDLLHAGAGKFVGDIGSALDQANPWGRTTRATFDETKLLDAPLMKTTPGKIGYGGAAALATAPAMMLPGANTVLGATLYGAGLGGLQPLGTGDSFTTNALWGAGGGFLGGAGASGASALLAPKVPSGARNLIDSGVTLTPGQRLGGGFKRAEDAMTSLPVTGDFIRNAQRMSAQDFNAAIANKALAPINDVLPVGLSGHKAVAYVERAIGDAYDSALKNIKNVSADLPFVKEITTLENMVKQGTMPPEVKDQFATAIKNQIFCKLQGQTAMTSQTFKEAESELGSLAAKYGADPSADKQLLGDALTEAQAAMRRWLERAAGPQYAADVQAANKGWAEFKRMQRASTFLGAKDGVFSAENYLNAVKALDPSKDKGAFARGRALGQPFGEDAVRTLGSTVPDSGTPFRTLMNKPIEGVVSTALTSPIAALSTPKSQALLQMLLSGKRPPLATNLAAELEMMKPLISTTGIGLADMYKRGLLSNEQ